MNYEELQEDVLKKIKKGTETEIEGSQNLMELGLNSLQVMRLVNQWRKQGIRVSYGELMETPTLEQWYRKIQESAAGIKKEAVKKKAKTGKAFPLTDTQYAYWVGRDDDQILGGIGCHAYFEFEGKSVVPERLQKAWNVLQYHHPMLRARFLKTGQQEIMERPYSEKISVFDLTGEEENKLEEFLLNERNRLSHRKLKAEEGQVAGITLFLLPSGKTRLCIDVDLLVADVQSMQILLRDLAAAYQEIPLPEASKGWDFSDYLSSQEIYDAETRKNAGEYWQKRLETLPEGPALPLRKKPEEIKETRFFRRKLLIKREIWEKLKDNAAKHKTTPAVMLLTAYASVIEKWSVNKRFLINIPLFNRNTEYAGLEEVIADFTALLLLEVDCSGDPGFYELLLRIQRQLHEDMKYASYSGVQVQRDLSRIHAAQQSAAPVVFACNLGTPLINGLFKETLGAFTYMISQTPQIWLDFQTYEDEEGLLLTWDAVDELFPVSMLDTMLDEFKNCLYGLQDENWDRNFRLSADSYEKFSNRDNITKGIEDFHCIFEGFLNYALKNPGKTALVDGEENKKITYGELKDEAVSIAAYLDAHGIRKQPVAISLSRGYKQIAAAYGIVISGNCYVPLGLNQPEERRKLIFEKTGIRHVITESACREEMENTGSDITILLYEALTKARPVLPDVKVTPKDSAYIIMTSGSTGLPKGVEIRHGSADNTIQDILDRFHITEEDTLLALSAMDFDLSVFDTFGILGCGGTLVMIPDHRSRDADYWLDLVRHHEVTIWNSVPVLLDMLLIMAEKHKEELPLKLVLLSGDWIGLDLPERVKHLTHDCRFIAMGGATEASIWSNFQEVTLPLPKEWKSIPYGRPLSNQDYRVVDENGQDCPEFTEGELLIGGCGLGSYHGDERLTEEKFITDGKGRWYRTGDRGRFWPDGTIEFLGRKDYQVKIRGHRIELGELEAAARGLQTVREAVAAIMERRNLVLYVAWKEGEQADWELLKENLHKKLPEYMIPKFYVPVDKIPVTANGKVDRKHLPEPQLKEHPAGESGSTETELSLLEIWKRVFGLDETGVRDNFFDMGGDSLTATRMCSVIQSELKVKVTIRDLFAKPVLKDLADHVDRLRRESVKEAEELPMIIPDPEGRYRPFRLTGIQYSYWIGRKGLYPLGNVSSHCYFEIEREGMDISLVEKGMGRLIKRHDMLRAVILPDGQGQVILKEVPEYKIQLLDLRDFSPEEAQASLQTVRDEMSHEKLDTSLWPLFHVKATAYGKNRMRLHISIDNIVIDAWSTSYLLGELARLYEYPEKEQEELEVSFADYINTMEKVEKTSLYENAREYWQNRIALLPPGPQLPLLQHPEDMGAQRFERYGCRIEENQWKEIKKRAKKYGITPSVVILTAYADILSCWSGSDRFTINITLFNRLPLHKQIHDIVGDFTSLILLAVDRRPEQSFYERCRDINEQLAADMTYSIYDGMKVQRELAGRQPGRGKTAAPVVFTSTIGVTDLDRIKPLGEIVFNITQTPQIWLDHQTREEHGALLLQWEAVEGLFSEETLSAMFERYAENVKRLAGSDEAWMETGENVPEFMEGVL
ncbi:amino acid adenylation domain-containing protein [Lachnospiraceae bacterium 54-53]